uniref:F-box domain-containing protein n=1 Tax=Aegilops tauschii subsp. strangulata TaxID=200361 RepID=A0A453Q3P4_AEGTS
LRHSAQPDLSSAPAKRWSPWQSLEFAGGQQVPRHRKTSPVMANMVEDSQDDRLSKLPDDVLLNIVERLGIVDVARTTVLSRRWKQIPAILSKVVILAGSFEPKHEDWSKLTPDDIVRANTTVLEATRSILERRAGSLYPIHLLRMQFYLGDESILIGQTVANAIATQKVDSAEFTILTKVRKKCTKNELLIYGKQFMSFFDSCPNAFGGLARLTLENLRLGESGFPKIFSICKQLEFLSLYECDMGIKSLLEVEHPQLSELVIVCGRFERVDLKWAPKLTKLKFNVFRCRDDPFCLGYVPLLQTVSIINVAFTWHKMLKLSELLDKAAISNLSLDFKSEKIWVKPEGRRQLLPVFHKLSILNLINIAEECDLTWTMFLLDGAPSLKELHILVRNHLCEMVTGKRRELPVVCKEKDKGLEWEPSTSDFKHHNLAGLSIYGRFHAVDKLVRFARNVVEAAVNLEDIRLYKSPVCVRCKYMLQEWTFEETSWLRYEFSKEIPSHVRIHFPSLGQVF